MSAGRGPVAYLVSQYPALSHAFIEREVLALRQAGVDVHTFSVRPVDPDAPFSAVTRSEVARTTTLLGRGAAEYASAQARLLAASPRAWFAGLGAALRAGPVRPRPKVWQLFYLAEAVLLVRHLRQRGIRHVHVHFTNNAADVARLAIAIGRALDGPGAGWRWTMSVHGPTDFTAVVARDLVAKVRSADAVAAISGYSRGEIERLVGPDAAAKTSVVRMTVSTDAYPAMGTERATRPDGPTRVLFVGRLVGEKAPEILVEAVGRLRAGGTEVEAAIIGQGPLAGALEEQVRRLGLTEHVRLVGPVGQDELPGWYRWADVFCLPSYTEGVPVVLMEAMATELPVVTTRITGIPELVDDDGSGILVAPGDTGAVVAAIARLGRSRELRRTMGERGRRRVTAAYAPATNAALLVQALRLDQASGAPTG